MPATCHAVYAHGSLLQAGGLGAENHGRPLSRRDSPRACGLSNTGGLPDFLAPRLSGIWSGSSKWQPRSSGGKAASARGPLRGRHPPAGVHNGRAGLRRDRARHPPAREARRNFRNCDRPGGRRSKALLTSACRSSPRDGVRCRRLSSWSCPGPARRQESR